MKIVGELDYYAIQEDQKLAYKEVGSGQQTLLFLHGMGSNMKAWSKNIAVLKSDFKCITLDLPGHGASDVLPEKYSIPKVATQIITFIKTKNLATVTLVGHSMGGQISMEIARQAPELVARIILLAPAGLEVYQESEIALIEEHFTAELIGSYPKGMIRKNFQLNFYEMPADARFMAEDRYELMEERPKYLQFCETMSQCTLAIVKHNMMRYLEQLGFPILILFGKEDKLIPHHILHPDKQLEEIVNAAMLQLKQGRVIVYEECGHFVQWEKSEEVNKEIFTFSDMT